MVKYIDDLAVPRFVVKLADLQCMGGVRPLNLTVNPGNRIKVVLSALAGAWAKGMPEMAISLNIK